MKAIFDVIIRTMKAVVVLSIFYFNYAHATDCTNSYSDQSFNFDDITLQRDTPVGTVVASKTVPFGSGYATAYGAGCQNGYGMVYIGGNASALTNVYKTNVDGIGIQVDYSGNPATNPENVPGVPLCCGSLAPAPPTIKLVVTGTVSSGSLTPGQVTYWYLDGIYWNASQASAKTYFYLSSSTKITRLACSLTSSSSLSFPIGNIAADQFTAVGMTSQQTSTQNLGLNCDAGANINVTLNGTQNPDSSDPSILALSGGTNVATGVGVQLLYDGKPLELNKLLNLKSSAGGQETFPITARYIQTKSTVTAGAANATATLNITYQ